MIGSVSVIHQITEFDLLITNATAGDYYACTDSKILYKDLSNNKNDRRIVNAVKLYTDSERSSIRPINGRLYYVWETNELWVYDSGWTIKVGRQRDSNGYLIHNGYIEPVSPTTDTDNVLDNNGLLGDGSVVIRDPNRLIKGKLYSEADTGRLVISSFLGAGMSLYPNGNDDSGSLQIYNKHIDEVTLEVLESKAVGWFKGEFNGTDDFYVNKESVQVEPTTVPTGYNYVLITLAAERQSLISANDSSTGLAETYIIRQDFTIKIYEDLTTTVEIVTTNTNNAVSKIEVIDSNDAISTAYTQTGTITSERIAFGTREVTPDGNLVVTTEEDIIITVYSYENSSRLGYDATVDYTKSSIRDEATSGYQILNVSASTRLFYRYILMHEGNFDIHKYVTPELVLEKLQQNEEPLDLTVQYLGIRRPNGDLEKYTPDDFALRIHSHQSGTFDENNVFIEQDLVDIDRVIYKIIQKTIRKGSENNSGIQVSSTDFPENASIEDMSISFDTKETNIEFQDYSVALMTEEELASIPEEESRYRNPTMGILNLDLENNNVFVRLLVNPYGHAHYIKDMKDYDEFLEWLDETYVPREDTVKMLYGEIAGVNEADKLVYTDIDGKLPVDITGTANDAKKLDHPVDITIHDTFSDTNIGEALDVDFSGESVTIDITIDESTHNHSKYVLGEGVERGPGEDDNDQVGVTVPSLDTNRIIKDEYLPINAKRAMYYLGDFNPEAGYPETPEKNYGVYSASASSHIGGELGAEYYKSGDLIIYMGQDEAGNPIWRKLEDSYADEGKVYDFNNLPLVPGVYRTVYNINVPIADLSTGYSWTAMVCTTNTNDKFLQYAIRSDGTCCVREAYKVYAGDGTDAWSIGYSNWEEVGSSTTYVSYTVLASGWEPAGDVVPGLFVYMNVLDTTMISPRTSINTRYDIYINDNETLALLMNCGVERLTVFNYDGEVRLMAYGAYPTADITLRIEATSVKGLVPSQESLEYENIIYNDESDTDTVYEMSTVYEYDDETSSYNISTQLVNGNVVAHVDIANVEDINSHIGYYFKYKDDALNQISQLVGCTPRDGNEVMAATVITKRLEMRRIYESIHEGT